eukprot:m.1654766 g.1654766  ORF g.1654766 m.1654766 type:complete len:51 (-) comp102244_c0_seq1:80-232(-)
MAQLAFDTKHIVQKELIPSRPTEHQPQSTTKQFEFYNAKMVFNTMEGGAS